jgi:predicted HTH transcriptional regulator
MNRLQKIEENKDKEINLPTKYIYNNYIKLYEDQIHEFKYLNIKTEQDIPNLMNIIEKYLCAFLNSNNGVIFIGISDDGYIKGSDIELKTLKKFSESLKNLINKFDSYVTEKNLIKFFIRNVEYNKNDYININHGLYVIEIFVKIGKMNEIYCTPNEGECYIKLNGTLKNLKGEKLFKYMKMKLKKYFYQESVY